MKKHSQKLKREDLEKALDKKTTSLEKMKLELKIEASLEAVRAVSLLMKKREDMLEVCTIIAKQLELLHVKEIRNVQTAIFYEAKGTYTNYEYYAKHDKTFVTDTTYTNHEIQNSFAAKMLKGNGEFMVAHIKGDEVKDWLVYQKTTNVFIDDYLNTASSLNYYWFSLGPVALGISTYAPLNKKEIALFKRFLKVFELSYRRYLDIEKAEAQSREAKIETALERVRSRSLAMHNSSEILEVVKAVSERLNELNIELNTAFIIISKEGSRDTEWWLINKDQGEYPRVLVKYADLLIMKNIFEAKESGKELFSATYHAEEKNELFRYLFTQTDFKYAPPERQKFIFESKSISISMAMTNKIAIQITRHHATPYSEADTEILKRFTKVFDQSYTRFLDLQKAEAQAKEAQIETALEKVRSRTMGMQKSEELKEIIKVVYEQFVHLNFLIEHAGFIMDYKERDDMNIWLTDQHAVPNQITIPYFDSPYWNSFNEAKAKGTDFFANHLSFEEKNKFYRELFDFIPGLPEEIKDYYFNCPGVAVSTVLLDNVGLYIENFSAIPYTNEENNTLMRFGKVFQQTYTRFNDLQKAEAQAREAQIEVALERVRGRTLAMQKSDELAETAAVVFRQLIGLGIEPNRLYIAIIKDNSGDMEFWITDEDGTRVGTKFSGNAHHNISFQKMYEGWEAHKKSITIDMHGDELITYFDHLNSLGVPFKLGLAQKRRMQNIAYFSKGFIGMASPEEQPGETIILLERFAAVFNLTYARFNDLQLAEYHAEQAKIDLQQLKAEKKRTEDALTELQATQKQLIQSEKMASLGELTAGIAHEIQNPLNFVTNFSDVNKELIDEMTDEIAKGNMDEVRMIANDIKENEEKINHHGKRADAIVKGMLQHSRSSSSAKEPTDINQLADEYLRLAYHGLRAKNNSFNAAMKTDFDSTIEKINIIPQDIARVLLNLFNNAFYAVNEKKRGEAESYQPTVSILTKKINDKIEIVVTDNGNGIPSNISDKIFQPFFTTKPTGQGTGLGLSLSYDIIKAHSGELKLETKGPGATFIIQLPIT